MGNTRKRILIVGGGFAGLYAAMQLERVARAGHSVTVVSAENFMQYQPFLPEVASGTIDPRAVVVPLRSVLHDARIVVAEVTSIDHTAHRVQARTADGTTATLDYDILVLTAGSWSRVLPVPGLAEQGIGFKTIQEAIYLRNHVLSRLDLAIETDDRAGAAPPSRSCSWAPGSRAWRRWASWRIWPATPARPTPR